MKKLYSIFCLVICFFLGSVSVSLAQVIPDLSSLDFETRHSIQVACVSTKSQGPVIYGRCINGHLTSLRSSPGIPDLSSLDFETRNSIQVACVSTKHQGPVIYGRCINGHLNSIGWKNNPNSTNPVPQPKTKIVPSVKPDPDKIVSVASGSGFAVSSAGHLVTNHHVIEGCENVKIHFLGKSIPATVLNYDIKNDLALLKGDFSPSTVLSLSEDNPELLQDVYVAGYPFGRIISSSVKITKGIISSLNGIGNDFSRFQIDAAIQKGNSGGPISDEKGNVVGVAVQTLDKQYFIKKFGSIPENINFGIKSNVLKNMLESNGITIPKGQKDKISKTQLGKIISDGTYYLSCWMTMAQIEEIRSNKVVFQDLQNGN